MSVGTDGVGDLDTPVTHLPVYLVLLESYRRGWILNIFLLRLIEIHTYRSIIHNVPLRCFRIACLGVRVSVNAYKII
jgi:hypothetical protein